MGDGKNPAGGCYSTIGRQEPMGRIVREKILYGQFINLGGDGECMNMGTILHETLHALGKCISYFHKKWIHFPGSVHEFSRWDRDSYVSVIEENIRIGDRIQFSRKSEETHRTRGTPFDLGSVMMYPSNAFGKKVDGSQMTTLQSLQGGVSIG